MVGLLGACNFGIDTAGLVSSGGIDGGTAPDASLKEDSSIRDASADAFTPPPPPPVIPVTKVVAGPTTTCALRSDGSIVCWGANEDNELGRGEDEPVDESEPGLVRLDAADQATDVAIGQTHACAILSGGSVKCWGANGYGQLGNGLTTPASSPQRVNLDAVGEPIVNLALSETATCALTASRRVFCWGNNAKGQLGDGSLDGSLLPKLVLGLPAVPIVELKAGEEFYCARTDSGDAQTRDVYCWGANQSGQTGVPAATNPLVRIPTKISALANVDEIATGRTSACARTSGQVYCWGNNTYRQLGQASTGSTSTPTVVPGVLNPTALFAGDFYACAQSVAGLQCWGRNLSGQLATGTLSPTSEVVTSQVANIKQLSAGGSHACALQTDGNVSCWGANERGRLGTGTRQSFACCASGGQGARNGVRSSLRQNCIGSLLLGKQCSKSARLERLPEHEHSKRQRDFRVPIAQCRATLYSRRPAKRRSSRLGLLKSGGARQGRPN
jgi:hypothetical protein